MSCRALSWLVICGLLAGCGFRPLYGGASQGSVGAEFLRVEIDTIKDREGQILRNELVQLFYGGQQPLAPAYRLTAELQESKTSLAVQKSAFATRGNLTVTGSFKLTDRVSGSAVFQNASGATASYNILDSEFASLLAEKNARDRALKQLAQDIRVRLASYFDRHRPETK